MSFRFTRLNFNSDPNIGMYGFATDSYCLLGIELSEKILEKLKKTLQVDIKVARVFGTQLIGLFCSGNENGIVITKMAEPDEIETIKKLLPNLNVLVIPTDVTATGNMILCNNNGAVISPALKKHKAKISKCLGCPVEVTTIAGLEVIGSAGIASQRGCLCHREASEAELDLIQKTLKVKTDLGTVGSGNPYIKSGVLVNTKGVVASEESTGPELGRIGDVFE
jgi:translation initiation factor 6